MTVRDNAKRSHAAIIKLTRSCSTLQMQAAVEAEDKDFDASKADTVPEDDEIPVDE